MNGIFITARLGSKRLSKKHLIIADGKPFIEWLITRFQTEFAEGISSGKTKIFITTSVAPGNEEFEKIAKLLGVKVFYGSDDNIPLRHLQCADENNIKNIISIDGDDILCSPAAAKMVLNELEINPTMVCTKGLPFGMNISGYTMSFLKKSLEGNQGKKLETGWGKIFDRDEIKYIKIAGFEQSEHLRMTLDYDKDADFFKAVIEGLKGRVNTISDTKLIAYILAHGLEKFNIELNEEYWANFNKQKQAES